MKKVVLVHYNTCPYCHQAFDFLNTLKPKYPNVAVELIDERKYPQIADKYDHYYVPAFFIDGENVLEGAVTIEQIESVLRKALD